jgi:hypothetical protein
VIICWIVGEVGKVSPISIDGVDVQLVILAGSGKYELSSEGSF